jgi:hypothetical protein
VAPLAASREDQARFEWERTAAALAEAEKALDEARTREAESRAAVDRIADEVAAREVAARAAEAKIGPQAGTEPQSDTLPPEPATEGLETASGVAPQETIEGKDAEAIGAHDSQPGPDDASLTDPPPAGEIQGGADGPRPAPVEAAGTEDANPGHDGPAAVPVEEGPDGPSGAPDVTNEAGGSDVAPPALETAGEIVAADPSPMDVGDSETGPDHQNASQDLPLRGELEGSVPPEDLAEGPPVDEGPVEPAPDGLIPEPVAETWTDHGDVVLTVDGLVPEPVPEALDSLGVEVGGDLRIPEPVVEPAGPVAEGMANHGLIPEPETTSWEPVPMDLGSESLIPEPTAGPLGLVEIGPTAEGLIPSPILETATAGEYHGALTVPEGLSEVGGAHAAGPANAVVSGAPAVESGAGLLGLFGEEHEGGSGGGGGGHL